MEDDDERHLMPGKPVPEGADDRAMLYALPEDQPDSLSEGHKSNQADLDDTPAKKAGTPDPGSKGQDPIVSNESESEDKPAPKKAQSSKK